MPTVLVFLKYPRPGEVKTRLAKTLGAAEAACLYRQWIGHVLTRVQPLRGEVRIVGYYDGARGADFANWTSLADAWHCQPHGDLGVRLDQGFAMIPAEQGPVVAIGTDCLQLEAQHVRDALRCLGEHDVVFGPTLDGGYYLVGTARHFPGFFREIPWSSRFTLAAHIARCQQHGWSVAQLPPLRDIDTIEDWQWHCSTEHPA